ncbi:cytochrome c nitrite reductase Fe-S protein, partial [Avibacterium paragallinarum]
MTTCSRRNFVSGMGALILMTGTAVKSVAQE